jgi:hypothetical protein
MWRLPNNGNFPDFMLTALYSFNTGTIPLIFSVCLSKIFLHTEVMKIMREGNTDSSRKKEMTLDSLKK